MAEYKRGLLDPQPGHVIGESPGGGMPIPMPQPTRPPVELGEITTPRAQALGIAPKPYRAEPVLAYGKYPTTVHVNPNQQTVRSLAKEGPVRTYTDTDNNLYAWPADVATHEHIQQQLRIPVKGADIWHNVGGRLISEGAVGGEGGALPELPADLTRQQLRFGAQHVQDTLNSLGIR
jgi:hypothetical protein